ncbi:MAG: FAD-binding oxidoreductase [Anaerolineae bacterium]|jgi:glycine/D-amino acid oxidase-like deaminating enzyme
MAENTYDVIMVGGGLMGCATAYYLMKADSRLRVAILEMDPTYERSSTILSDGNVRVQFNLEENIRISQYGLEAIERFAEDMAVDDDRPDVAFRREGNLFLIDTNGREEAERGLALQQDLGCQVEWLTPAEIKRRYPLYDLAECVGGTFGRQDGTMDPWALLMGYKRKAIALGAQLIHGEVVELLRSEDRITGVRLSSGDRLTAKAVVNSAGAWATLIAQTAGVDLPVEPTKRQVFVIETNARPDGFLPAVFFPSGLYCIHEREGHFMCGKSLPDDPVGFEFTWNRRVFDEILWPELVDFVPSFDRLKVARGWAGLYAVNVFDGNAILGEWPELEGFYLANGFSGHGFQQCHAVGRYIAELIMGQTPTLDLSIFSPKRILENKPVFESQGKIV